MKSLAQRVEELHAQYCAVRSSRAAVFWVGFCALELFFVLRTRHLFDRHWIELPFYICAIGLCAFFVLQCNCLPERLIVAFAAASLVIGTLSSYLPTFFVSLFYVIRDAKIALWIGALVVSLSLLVNSTTKM